MATVAAILLAGLVASKTTAAAGPADEQTTRHTVSYDHYSAMIDGRRVVIRAAEFHYFRLPSPDLWADVLEKYKAAGFNAVSIYFDWAYHSPAPGVYDFTGVRDVDELLRMAEQVGLYVIARPGPYINAEVSGGGFPAWLKEVPGRARSSAPGYTVAYQDWLGHIDPILARHQVTNGGSVLLYNAENEYAVNTDAAYMQAIQEKARADGIDVPITANDCCDAASWSSTWATGAGAVQIPGVDDYAQSFDCANPTTTWGPWGEGVTERLRDDAPVFAAEYQAGSIDQPRVGYDQCRELTGVDYTRFFNKRNVITSGATAFNYYMGFGGTNWGWLGQPNDVYTSYDYGAPITESRQLTAKYDEFKRQNYFLQAVPSIAKTDSITAPVADNPAVATVARANPDTGAQFVLVTHADRNSTSTDTATLDWSAPDGHYSLPVRVDSHDARILVAGVDLGGQRLVWSNSELMTDATIGGRDIALLHGPAGESGSTVLRYSSEPAVHVLDGAATTTYDATTGDLRINYVHSGLIRIAITGGRRPPLLLLLATTDQAARFWRADTPSGPVLVHGTELLRSASVHGGVADLRADTSQSGPIEVWAGTGHVLVNDAVLTTRQTPSGSLLGNLGGPKAVRLPALSAWRTARETPEAQPGFDDSGWTAADHTTTTAPLPPKTLPVLYADDYGYHYGNVWYRGHFTASGSESTVSLNAITGLKGVYLVWLNGRYLGSAAGGNEADADAGAPDPGHGDFAIPPGTVHAGQLATLSVLVENMGHNDDWTADDNRFKQPRGLVAATVGGAQISWRIQGARGGENLPDPTRGPLNVGGLDGERAGWYLPDFPDGGWQSVSSPAATSVDPGVSWYRTTFDVDLPRGQDTSVGLHFDGPPASGYRVLAFLNGWNVGQYSADVGPQRDFVLPAGLLREHGGNTFALAVLAEHGVTPPGAELVVMGTQRGGVPVNPVHSPGYHEVVAATR
ncbi:MAG TPA: beta-galactosidase [Jatrophihabitantaceae bacterium]|nr:beta-galactosidase [Jatrophihabitantaceae bacterium]